MRRRCLVVAWALLLAACAAPRNEGPRADAAADATPMGAADAGVDARVPSAGQAPPPVGGSSDAAAVTPTPPPPGPSDPRGFTLTVQVAGAEGRVRSAGVDCAASCSHFKPRGTELVFDAVPASGNIFEAWSGACTGTGACRVTLDRDRTVTATFRAVIRAEVDVPWQQIAVADGAVYFTSLVFGTYKFGDVTLTSAGFGDFVIGRGDASGRTLWAKSFGGAGDERPHRVRTAPGGDVVATGFFGSASLEIAGTTLVNPRGENQLASFLVRFSPEGTLRSAVVVMPGPVDVAIDGQGDVLVVRDSAPVLANAGAPVFAKLASSGRPGWTSGDGFGITRMRIAVDGAGDGVFCGSLAIDVSGTPVLPAGAPPLQNLPPGFFVDPAPLFVVGKLSGASGRPLWLAALPSRAGSNCDELALDSGDVVATGSYAGALHAGAEMPANAGVSGIVAARFAGASGALSWVSVLGAVGSRRAEIAVGPGGGAVVLAVSTAEGLLGQPRPEGGGGQTFLVTLDPTTGARRTLFDLGRPVIELLPFGADEFLALSFTSLSRIAVP